MTSPILLTSLCNVYLLSSCMYFILYSVFPCYWHYFSLRISCMHFILYFILYCVLRVQFYNNNNNKSFRRREYFNETGHNWPVAGTDETDDMEKASRSESAGMVAESNLVNAVTAWTSEEISTKPCANISYIKSIMYWRSWVQRSNSWPLTIADKVNPFTTDPVKALHFAILVRL